MGKKDNIDIGRLEMLSGQYMEGVLDDAGEAELRELLCRMPEEQIPSEYKALSLMFRGFARMHREKAPQRKTRRLHLPIAVSVAVAAAVAVAVILSRVTVYGYDSDGRPITDPGKALSQTECLHALEQFEFSLRTADELAVRLENHVPENNTDN